MSKKEELIERLCRTTQLVAIKKDEFGYHGEITPATMSVIYDEIRASILTPKVVALLKATGGKPYDCQLCEHFEWGFCHFQKHGNKCPSAYRTCPLLTAEELKEITE